MLSGFNFYNLHSETFILGGVTLHESERTILTNTTTTGTLDVEDNYYSVKALTGTKFKSKKLIPDIGFTASGSITPNHSESKYYTWNTKSILNLSAYFEDEYNFNIKNSGDMYEIKTNEIDINDQGNIIDTDIFTWGLFLSNSNKYIYKNKEDDFINRCDFTKGLIKITAEIKNPN